MEERLATVGDELDEGTEEGERGNVVFVEMGVRSAARREDRGLVFGIASAVLAARAVR